MKKKYYLLVEDYDNYSGCQELYFKEVELTEEERKNHRFSFDIYDTLEEVHQAMTNREQYRLCD